MKKFTKVFALVLVAVVCLSIFTACSNISQAYADKINKAAGRDEHLEYLDVMNDLGDNAIDITILKTGVIVAAQGCESLEELNAKLDAGKTVKGIIVTVVGGKAVSAKYTEITEEDLK